MMFFTLKVFLLWSSLSAATFALECHQCHGVRDCNEPAQQDNVVKCDPGHAHSTLHHLTDMFPSVESEIEPSDEFICVFANFTLQNQLVERYRTKGCLFKNNKICSLRPTPYTGFLDCLSCSLDRCNSATSLVHSTLLVVGVTCFAMWLSSKD